MSAYVVEDECINSIVTYLCDHRRSWERTQLLEALEKQGTIGDSLEEQLGNAMFELNCNAVDQRYGDNQAKEFRDLDYQWRPNYLDSGYAVYDRLGEYLYQCSEGDVPDSSGLYKALDRIYAQLAHEFFRNLRNAKESQDADIRRELGARISKLESLFSQKQLKRQG